MNDVARRIIDGRTALDRAGVAAHTGAAYTTVNHWHRHRARFGFPHGFTHDGKEWYWLDDIEAFHTAHLAAKRAELTKVDRRGDPEDLIGSGAAARSSDTARTATCPIPCSTTPTGSRNCRTDGSVACGIGARCGPSRMPVPGGSPPAAPPARPVPANHTRTPTTLGSTPLSRCWPRPTPPGRIGAGSV